MDHSFWQDLPKPIIGLSPMDGVTDHPFRHITKKYGRPVVMYTEFTSVEGVCHGAAQLLKDFLFDETQRPIVAQVYGTTPEFFRETVIILCELGFDGIDINMGCPAKNVAHLGAGAALIRTPDLAQEIIRATQTGVEEWQNGKRSRDCADISEEIWQEVEARHSRLPAKYQERRKLPISVKTRLGYDAPVVEEWLPRLLAMNLSVITLHGRTLKQQYGGRADWEQIGRAAALAHQTQTLLFGNGDVTTLADALQKVKDFNVDGVLIGRASFGNPQVFLTPDQPQPNLYAMALEHAQIYEDTFKQTDRYNFMPMRKHLGWYIHDIPDAAKIRQRLYQTNSTADVAQIFREFHLVDDILPATVNTAV